MGQFVMPSLGADMTEGTVIRWLVQPGDRVRRGDIVAIVDTDKADVEVEIFESGVVEQLLVEVGRKVPVGTPLALVGGPVAAKAAERVPPVVAAPAAKSAPPVIAAKAAEPAPAALAPAPRPVHAASSPYARRRAAELGVDLAALGVLDRPIHGHDVEAAARATGALPDRVSERRVERDVEAPSDRASERRESMRRAIAGLMARSKREVPHYYLSSDIDLTDALEWLGKHNASRAVDARVLPVALILRAIALGLQEVPGLNGFWRDDRFEPAAAVHLGVAISLRGGGLIAPAILDAGSLSVDDLMARLKDLVERARNGALRASELSAGTVTVTNLGDQGVDAVLPVIYPPQVAIVGVGRVRERPWAINHMLTVRSIVTMTLAADHRASDGHLGGRLLTAIGRRLQRPSEL